MTHYIYRIDFLFGKKHVEGIMRCAEGLQESSYGYKWKFVNE